MKQENLQKGCELFNGIESCQVAKAALDQITEGRLLNPQKTLMNVRVNNNLTYFEGINHLPPELVEQIKEEFIRFLQRSKRHCEEWEFKLKQQFEDL